MLSWQTNMDIQFVLNAYACVMYVASYVMKRERLMGELGECTFLAITLSCAYSVIHFPSFKSKDFSFTCLLYFFFAAHCIFNFML